MTTGISGEKNYKNSSVMAVINSAVETLCRSLAVKLKPVKANVVSPRFAEQKPKDAERYSHNFPLKRLALSEEIAEAYVYLTRSAYTTGTTVVVDSGAGLI